MMSLSLYLIGVKGKLFEKYFLKNQFIANIILVISILKKDISLFNKNFSQI